MRSVPASPHFFVQLLLVNAEERGHFGAVAAEENQFAMLPIPPSRRIDPKVEGSLSDGPAVDSALSK